VAVPASHLAFRDLRFQFRHARASTNEISDRRFLVASNVIEVEDPNVGFATVHAPVCEMSDQVLARLALATRTRRSDVRLVLGGVLSIPAGLAFAAIRVEAVAALSGPIEGIA